MDETTYKERVKRLKEVDQIIKALDPSIRESGFKLLQGYVTGSKVHPESGQDDVTEEEDGASEESIFTEFDHDKPSDNVLLITAHHFNKYGNSVFSLDDINQIAAGAGLTIPDRPNMTLTAASRNGKKLFTKVGRGKFKPTVHGEKFLKDTYKVSKGTKQKAGDAEE